MGEEEAGVACPCLAVIKEGDRIDAVGWAAGFLWGALVILAGTTGLAANYAWWDGWSVFFTGAGIIVLVGAAVRWLVPGFRRSFVADLVFGSVLLAVGLGDLVPWEWILPVVMIAVAIAILRRGR